MGKLSNDPVIDHHFSHHHPLELSTCQQINTTAPCYGCKLPLSGWLYTCKPCNFSLHLPCSKAPQLIHHPSHPNHPLSLLPHPSYPQGYFNCDACGHRGDAFSYHCATCDIDLHVLCASMLLSLFHQDHHHPLNLTFFTPYQNKGFSCDICRNMGSNHWLYRCGVCEFDAHLACAGSELRPLAQAQGLIQPQQHELDQRIAIGTPQFRGPGAAYVNGQGAGGPPVRSGQGKWLLDLTIQGLLGGVPLQVGQSLAQSLSRGQRHRVDGGGGGCGADTIGDDYSCGTGGGGDDW